MGATEYRGNNIWRHNLKSRKCNFTHFHIRKAYIDSCKIEKNTKRRIKIELSDGRKLRGCITISSGTELIFPADLQEDLRSVDWFEYKISGQKLCDTPKLKWV